MKQLGLIVTAILLAFFIVACVGRLGDIDDALDNIVSGGNSDSGNEENENEENLQMPTVPVISLSGNVLTVTGEHAKNYILEWTEKDGSEVSSHTIGATEGEAGFNLFDSGLFRVGTYNVTVKGFNACGVSQASNSVTFTVGSVLNVQAPEISLNGSEITGIGINAAYAILYLDGNAVASTTTTNYVFTFDLMDVDLELEINSTHLIHVVTKDWGGNTAQSNTLQYTYVPVYEGGVPVLSMSDTKLMVIVDQAIYAVDVYVNGTSVYVYTPTEISSAYAFNFFNTEAGTLDPGTHSITIKVQDENGAWSGFSNAITYTVEGETDDGGSGTETPVKGEAIKTFTENELLNGISEFFLEAGKGYFVEDLYFVAVQREGDGVKYIAPPEGTVISNSENQGAVVYKEKSWYVSWDNGPIDERTITFYKVVGETYTESGGNGDSSEGNGGSEVTYNLGAPTISGGMGASSQGHLTVTYDAAAYDVPTGYEVYINGAYVDSDSDEYSRTIMSIPLGVDGLYPEIGDQIYVCAVVVDGGEVVARGPSSNSIILSSFVAASVNSEGLLSMSCDIGIRWYNVKIYSDASLVDLLASKSNIAFTAGSSTYAAQISLKDIFDSARVAYPEDGTSLYVWVQGDDDSFYMPTTVVNTSWGADWAPKEEDPEEEDPTTAQKGAVLGTFISRDDVMDGLIPIRNINLIAGKRYFIGNTLFVAEWYNEEGYVAIPEGTVYQAADGVVYTVDSFGGPGLYITPANAATFTIYYVEGEDYGFDTETDLSGRGALYATYNTGANGSISDMSPALVYGQWYYIEDTLFQATYGPNGADGYVVPPSGLVFTGTDGVKYTVGVDPSDWYVYDSVGNKTDFDLHIYSALESAIPQKGDLYISVSNEDVSRCFTTLSPELVAGTGYFIEDVYFVAEVSGDYIAPPVHTVFTTEDGNYGEVYHDGSGWTISWWNAPENTYFRIYSVAESE